MEKRKYKLLAFILILSLIFPFFPSVYVSADGLSFLPDFPYGQDNYYNVNNGSFALWQIHNSNYLTYVQTFTPNNISYPNPIIIFNKTWLETNYTYYLDYTYIIDSWDIAGLHSDGFAGTQNIRVPSPNSDFVSDNVVYATLLYTTDNVIWKNGNDVGVYAYTNFYPDGYVDPTPTPEPSPVYGIPFDCPYSLTWENPVASNYTINNGAIIRVRDEANDNYEYYYILSGYNNNWNYQSWKLTLEYNLTSDSVRDTLSLGTVLNQINTSHRGWVGRLSSDTVINSAANFTGSATENFVFTTNYDFLVNFTILNSSGTYYIDGLNFIDNSIMATPTPTAIPTAIPQPTTNPNPTATPEPDVKIVQPSNHWWDGLVKPIQYIFVPSSDKMMRTYNIMSTKFGVQKPTEFKFDVNSLVRPNNVVWKFKHASLDGSNTTETQITLIDFEMIDGWLETSAGRMIIRIIRAVFGLLMWAYLMYIYRKHIATINYTDAETLKDISRNNGGGDEDV